MKHRNRSCCLVIVAIATLVLFSISQGRAALYQWSIPQESGRRAYLWIPEDCRRIRGLVVDMNNLTECRMIEHPAVRETCAQERVGILWIAEGSWAASPLANRWGDEAGLSKEQRAVFDRLTQAAKSARKNPTAEQEKAIAALKEIKLELARQAEEELNNMLRDLAKESGYEEVEHAPLLILGHSMTGLITWAMPYWIPARMWGAIPIKTGVRGDPPPEKPDATKTGVPMLYINQSESEGPAGKAYPGNGPVAGRRNPANMVGQVIDWGGSHFEMTDEMASLIALFIQKAAKVRLADEIPADAYPKLKDLKPESGWLATSLSEQEQFPMSPEPQYKGDKTKAFWFIDAEMAKAAVNHNLAHRKRKLQYVTVVSNGKMLQPLTGPFDAVKIPFESGIDDGLAFKLTGAFLNSVPARNPVDSKPCEHAMSGKVSVKIAGGGSLVQLDDNTFRFRPGNLGFAGKALNCWLVATHPGDAQYSRCNQPAHLALPERLTKGKPQSITFDRLPNVLAGTREVTLAAKANSGLPVEYYVVSGPAEVDGSKLRLTAIPPRARMPVKVIVTAYQIGRSLPPLTQSAKPIEQSFLIVSSEKDLSLTPTDPVFVPPASRMPDLTTDAKTQ